MSNQGWIGVDLDSTLAYYDKWRGSDHIGEPIKEMVDRVKAWQKQGREVRIFTARTITNESIKRILDWAVSHGMAPMLVTNVKDRDMDELWDDRAVQVIKNKGTTLQQRVEQLEAALKVRVWHGTCPHCKKALTAGLYVSVLHGDSLGQHHPSCPHYVTEMSL